MPEALSLEQFVAQQLKSGRYQSYEGMVQARPAPAAGTGAGV